MIDGSQVPIYTYSEDIWPQELSPNRIQEIQSTFSSNPSPSSGLLLSACTAK